MRIACVSEDPGVQPDRHKGAAVHLRAMRDAFSDHDVEVVALDHPDSATLGRALQAAWDEKPFDLIYERYALGRTTATDFAEERGVPLVLEANAPLAEEHQRWRNPDATSTEDQEDRRVFSRAALVIAVTDQVADYAVRRGAQRELVSVFPNGVDTTRFRPRAENDELRRKLVPPGRFVLGFHGRLRAWHGFDRLVTLTAMLLAVKTPVHLVLVGEGDFDEHLHGRVSPEHVTRVGWVEHEEVAPYVATFDALPLTYPPDLPCYFSPLKLAEAMACGVVPLVPRLGDLSRVVRHEENGLLYEADDLDKLRDAVRGLILSPQKRTLLAQGAIATAREMSWSRIASFVVEQTRARR